jgi:23S rRNA (pseudouridine1915-N3)-methyltransferase
MKVRFVWVGKTRNAGVRGLVEDYLERTRRFTRVEVTEVRDSGEPPGRRSVNRKAASEKEGEELLSRIGLDPLVVLLEERGRQVTSIQLADFMRDQMLAGTKQLTFVVGGHCGVSGAVRSRADMVVGLSKMTLTHEMARLVLTEQVYRAFTIINKLPYAR